MTCFVVMRLLVVPLDAANLYDDSDGYIAEARRPWNDFLNTSAGERWKRAPGYPFILKLCGLTGPDNAEAIRRIILLQCIVSGIAFAVLARTVTVQLCRSRAGILAAYGLIALFSLSWQSGPWDALILTESLTLSLFVLLAAVLLRLFEGASIWPWPTAALICFALSRIRDANTLLVFCLLMPALGLIVRRWQRWKSSLSVASILCLLAIMATAVTAQRSAMRNRRGDGPLTSVLSLVVFEQPSRFDVFVREYGLPPSVAPLVGQNAWYGWLDHEEYARWLVERAHRSYYSFLVTNPGFVLRRTDDSFRERAEEVASQELLRHFTTYGRRPFPGLKVTVCSVVSQILIAPVRVLIRLGPYAPWVLLVGILATCTWMLRRGGPAGAIYVLIFMLLTVVSQSLAVSFLDAIDDARHAFLASGSAILAACIGLAIIIDRLFPSRKLPSIR